MIGIAQAPIAQAISSALLQFLWQGMVVALLLWVTLFGLRRRSPQARYLASCAALVVLFALPILTASVSYLRAAPVSSSSPPVSAAPGESVAAVTTTAPAIVAAIERLQDWALPIWSMGVLLFSIRLVWGCRQVTLLRAWAQPADSSVVGIAVTIAARMGLTRRVRLLTTTTADSPAVIGWIRPVILLPSATLLGLTTEQLEGILAHELAHIRRYDHLVNLLQTFVETVLFYHPAVWWASARMRHERELCCDDLAVRSCGDPVCYARALTRLERLRSLDPVVAVGSRGGSLVERVERLVGRGHDYGPSKLSGVVALTLALGCFALNVHWARGQEPQTARAFLFVSSGDSAGVTVDLGGATVVHRPMVEYPGPALEKGVQGSVTVEATVDATGDVQDARVVAGPPELRRIALSSVLQWHFAPAKATVHQVTLNFDLNAARAQRQRRENEEKEARQQFEQGTREDALKGAEQAVRELRAKVREGLGTPETDRMLRRQLEELQAHNEQLSHELEEQHNTTAQAELAALQESLRAAQRNIEPANRPDGLRLTHIEVALPEAARTQLLSRLHVQVGDTLTGAAMERLTRDIRSYDQHLEVNFTRTEDGNGVGLRIAAPGTDMPVELRIRK